MLLFTHSNCRLITIERFMLCVANVLGLHKYVLRLLVYLVYNKTDAKTLLFPQDTVPGFKMCLSSFLNFTG